jgi:uncharacterized membrane protein YGL010W
MFRVRLTGARLGENKGKGKENRTFRLGPRWHLVLAAILFKNAMGGGDSKMSPLVRYLVAYGEYHRDRRNIGTHLVGIPMIVLAVEILLSRPVREVGSYLLTPAILFSAFAALFYLRLDIKLGLVMTALLALCAWAGLVIARMSTWEWLENGISLFLVGWVFQLVGHAYEGRKPAFLDDLKSLLIGPLFVVTELGFAMGMRHELRAEMERADR